MCTNVPTIFLSPPRYTEEEPRRNKLRQRRERMRRNRLWQRADAFPFPPWRWWLASYSDPGREREVSVRNVLLWLRGKKRRWRSSLSVLLDPPSPSVGQCLSNTQKRWSRSRRRKGCHFPKHFRWFLREIAREICPSLKKCGIKFFATLECFSEETVPFLFSEKHNVPWAKERKNWEKGFSRWLGQFLLFCVPNIFHARLIFFAFKQRRIPGRRWGGNQQWGNWLRVQQLSRRPTTTTQPMPGEEGALGRRGGCEEIKLPCSQGSKPEWYLWNLVLMHFIRAEFSIKVFKNANTIYEMALL